MTKTTPRKCLVKPILAIFGIILFVFVITIGPSIYNLYKPIQIRINNQLVPINSISQDLIKESIISDKDGCIKGDGIFHTFLNIQYAINHDLTKFKILEAYENTFPDRKVLINRSQSYPHDQRLVKEFMVVYANQNSQIPSCAVDEAITQSMQQCISGDSNLLSPDCVHQTLSKVLN